MINLALCGATGAMGKSLSEKISLMDDAKVLFGIATNAIKTDFPIYTKLSLSKEKVDAIIDFSHPSLLDDILEYGKKNKTALVLCTTGYTEDDKKKIIAASKGTAIFYSRNMSLGINLLQELSKIAAKVLSSFDVEIIEAHHNKKIDAPSGTALMLAEAVKEERENLDFVYDRTSVRQARNKTELGIHSVRGGTVVGEHSVIFLGEQERITLSHSAESKGVFAMGAINAAKWLKDKEPGLYDMSHMLAEINS